MLNPLLESNLSAICYTDISTSCLITYPVYMGEIPTRRILVIKHPGQSTWLTDEMQTGMIFNNHPTFHRSSPFLTKRTKAMRESLKVICMHIPCYQACYWVSGGSGLTNAGFKTLEWYPLIFKSLWDVSCVNSLQNCHFKSHMHGIVDNLLHRNH